MSSQLSALSNILSSGIATIESVYAKNGATFPSLDEPFKPPPFAEDALLSQIIDHVISAAAQLIMTVKPPQRTLVESSLSFHLPASLQLAEEANIPEILREAGPGGLDVKDIGERCGSDSSKVGRVLRYLATNHIFKEVSPDVFANNRVSSVMDTGKSVATLKADHMSKHDKTTGVAALVGHITDEAMKSGIFMAENLLDPKTSGSQELLDASFSRAHGRQSGHDFFEKPENAYRLRRFGAAMNGTRMSMSPGTTLNGYDWKSLKQDSLVVDVGGGVGSSVLELKVAFPHLRFVVQDRPKVIDDAAKFWGNEDPEALKSGTVKLQAHDFFEPQPIKDATVFFLRFIMHDWADKYAKPILKQLRGSAQPSTKLILCDFLVPYAAYSNDLFSDVPGANVPAAPYPLLANLGTVSNQAVQLDLQMMASANAQERTIGQFISLAEGTGWKLSSIGRTPKSLMCLIIFDPVPV